MLSQKETDKWISTISQDRKFQKDTRHQIWKDNINRFTGLFHFKDILNDRETVNVNFVSAYVRTVLPAVYFKDPYIFVEARTEEELGKASVIEAVINYIWREINLKEEVKRIILDTILFGIGWIKIGYTAEFGRKVTESPVIPEGQTDRKTPEGNVISFNEYIKEENVFGVRISPFNVLVPRGYNRFEDMPYIIEEKLMDIEDVKKDKSLKHTEDLTPTHKLDTGFSAIDVPNMSQPDSKIGQLASKMSGSEKSNKVVIWEVWDKRSQKIYTFGKGATKPLKEEDWFLDIEGFPYVPLQFNLVPNSDELSNFYPMSDIEPLIPQLTELSRLRTAMVKHRKKFMRKYLVEKGAMTQDQVDILKEPETGLVAEVNDITKVIPTPDITVPQDLYRVNDAIKNDLMEISGISQLLLGGGAAPGVNTATEAAIVQRGSTLRIAEKQDIVEDFTRNVARKLIQILRQYVDRTFSLRMMVEGKEVDIRGTREDLQAEVGIKVEAGSTQPPMDTSIERKQLIDLAIGVLSNPMFARFVNPRLLLQKIAKRFPALKDSKLFTGGVEDEQLIAQQENQLLANRIIQLVHPNDDHDIHLKIHSIMAQDPASTTPEMAQHIKSHVAFIEERRSFARGSRNEALTPKNITEQGATRQGDTFTMGSQGVKEGTGASPPRGMGME